MKNGERERLDYGYHCKCNFRLYPLAYVLLTILLIKPKAQAKINDTLLDRFASPVQFPSTKPLKSKSNNYFLISLQ